MKITPKDPSIQNEGIPSEKFDHVLTNLMKIHGSEKKWQSALEIINKISQMATKILTTSCGLLISQSAFLTTGIFVIPIVLVGFIAAIPTAGMSLALSAVAITIPILQLSVAALVYALAVSTLCTQKLARNYLQKGSLEKPFKDLIKNLEQLSKFGVDESIIEAIHIKKPDYEVAEKIYKTAEKNVNKKLEQLSTKYEKDISILTNDGVAVLWFKNMLNILENELTKPRNELGTKPRDTKGDMHKGHADEGTVVAIPDMVGKKTKKINDLKNKFEIEENKLKDELVSAQTEFKIVESKCLDYIKNIADTCQNNKILHAYSLYQTDAIELNMSASEDTDFMSLENFKVAELDKIEARNELISGVNWGWYDPLSVELAFLKAMNQKKSGVDEGD